MKIFKILLIIAICSPMIAKSQFLIHDVSMIRTNDNGDVILDSLSLAILKRYGAIHSTAALSDNLQGLNSKIDTTKFRNLRIGGQLMGDPPKNNLTGNAQNKLIQTDITTFADGLTRFMINRAKEELIITYFDRFKKQMNDTTFTVLFPKTKTALLQFDPAVFSYTLFIPTLRAAFDADLKQLPQHVLNLAWMCDSSQNEGQQQLLSQMSVLATVGIGLEQNKHPRAIISELPTQGSNPTLNATTSIIQVLSEAFADPYSNTWLPADQLTSFFSKMTPTHVELLTGFLCVSLNQTGLKINNTLIGETILKKAQVPEQSRIVWHAFTELSTHLTGVQNQLVSIQNTSKADRSAEQYLSLAAELSAFMLSMNQGITKLTQDELPNSMLAKQAFVLQEFGAVIQHAQQKNYVQALLGSLQILDSLNLVNAQLKHKIAQYGMVMAAIVEAENSEEVEKLINSVVLGPGSWRNKQNHISTVTVNGYLGVNYRNEINRQNISRINEFGVYAPVGLSASWSFCKKKNYGALTLFMPLIDLGGIAQYRFDDATKTLEPKVTLGNIWSPGVGLFYAIPTRPIVIGATYQSAPQLQYIDNALLVNEALNQNRFRWNIVVGFDISLFNVWTGQPRFRTPAPVAAKEKSSAAPKAKTKE